MWKHEFEAANDKETVDKYYDQWRNSETERKWTRVYGCLDIRRDRHFHKQILFSRSCKSGRQVKVNLIRLFMENRSHERKKEKKEFLNEVLVEVGEAGEKSEEFIESYHNLTSTGDWRYSLTEKEILQLTIGNMSLRKCRRESWPIYV